MINNNNVKIIFHIDMNAFFATVAAIVNPTLKGKAFAIGRENSFKGVISTASYEARKYGINSAMPLSVAYKILPTLIVVNPNFKLYEEYHQKFVALVKRYSNLVEVASIDEVYADMTEASQSIHPIDLAKEIQNKLLSEFNLPCSIGIAPTLYLAKMGSDMQKPLGLTVVRKRDLAHLLFPLSVKDIYGIGKKTYPRLIEHEIKTIADFMNAQNEELIISLIGQRSFLESKNCLLGNSSNDVLPNRYANNESISTSQTYDQYLQTEDDIIIELRSMTKKIHKKMVLDNYVTKTVSITLRDKNFKTSTRSRSFDHYTKDIYEILDLVVDLFEDNYRGEELRLVGVGLSSLMLESQLKPDYNLFTFESIIEKEAALRIIMLKFKDKYGDEFINKGLKEE